MVYEQCPKGDNLVKYDSTVDGLTNIQVKTRWKKKNKIFLLSLWEVGLEFLP